MLLYDSNELIFDQRHEFVSALQSEREVTNILIVDDLHDKDRRDLFDEHVSNGHVAVLDSFVVKSASSMDWVFEADTQSYKFINTTIINPFSDGLLVTSKYIQ